MTSGWTGNRFVLDTYPFAKAVQSSGPPRGLKERILAEAASKPSPTRATSRAYALITGVSSIVVAMTIFLAWDGPRHGQGRQAWYYAASILGWTIIAAASGWAAFGRGRSAVGRSRAWMLAVATATPALLLGMMWAFTLVDPTVTEVHPERLGLKCLSLTLSAAVLPLAGLFALRSGSDPVHPGTTGAALGAASGAAAGIMVELWCPVGTVQHIALGHIVPIVVLALLGAVIGRRVLAVRSR